MRKTTKFLLTIMCVASMAMSSVSLVSADVVYRDASSGTYRTSTTQTEDYYRGVRIIDNVVKGYKSNYRISSDLKEMEVTPPAGYYPVVYFPRHRAELKEMGNGVFKFDITGVQSRTTVTIDYVKPFHKVATNLVYYLTFDCLEAPRNGSALYEAFPAAGYQITDIRIVHGAGTLQRNGNQYRVIGGNTDTIVFFTIAHIPGYQPPVVDNGPRGGGSR